MSKPATATQENLMIPFSSIDPDMGFNSRTIYDDLEELAESIKTRGLITPLTVMKNGGDTYKLVAGYRRYRALEMLKTGDKPVKVNIESYESDGDLYLANLVENTARDAMHPSDLGKRFAELEAGTYRRVLSAAGSEEGDDTVGQKISRKEIAKHTGVTVSHIGNLIRVEQKLSDAVKKMWRKHDVPMSKIFKWAALEDDDSQMEAFGTWKEELDAEKSEGKKKKKSKEAEAAAEGSEEESEGEEGGETSSAPQGPSKSEMRSQKETLQEKIDSGKLKGEELAVAKAKHKTLRWVLGDINRL